MSEPQTVEQYLLIVGTAENPTCQTTHYHKITFPSMLTEPDVITIAPTFINRMVFPRHGSRRHLRSIMLLKYLTDQGFNGARQEISTDDMLKKLLAETEKAIPAA